MKRSSTGKNNSKPSAARLVRTLRSSFKVAIAKTALRRPRNALASVAVTSQFKKPLKKALKAAYALRSKNTSKEPTRQAKPFNGFTRLQQGLVCAKRSIRREVLFAKKEVGNGVKIHTSKHFTKETNVKC